MTTTPIKQLKVGDEVTVDGHDVQALREALIEEVSALLGEFQITEVDGNMKMYGTRIFEAVIKKAVR